MGREVPANRTTRDGGSQMSDEELAAEIRRRMDMAQHAPRIARPPVAPPIDSPDNVPGKPLDRPAASPPPSTQEFGLLDGMRMPADELAAEIKRRLERWRDAKGEDAQGEAGDETQNQQMPPMSAGPVSADAPQVDAIRPRSALRADIHPAEIKRPEVKRVRAQPIEIDSAYVPVTLPPDQVIPFGAYDRYEQKIRATPAPPRRRKGLYFVAAVAILAAIAAPGSWNAISRHQEATLPVATNLPTAVPQTASAMPTELTREEAVAEKAAAEAAAEKMAVEKAQAEQAAAEKALAEKALAEKAAAEKAAADKARLDAIVAIEAARPKVLTPSVGAMTPKPLAPSTPSPTTSTAAPSGNLPIYTPSSSDGWLKPKPFDPSAP